MGSISLRGGSLVRNEGLEKKVETTVKFGSASRLL